MNTWPGLASGICTRRRLSALRVTMRGLSHKSRVYSIGFRYSSPPSDNPVWIAFRFVIYRRLDRGRVDAPYKYVGLPKRCLFCRLNPPSANPTRAKIELDGARFRRDIACQSVGAKGLCPHNGHYDVYEMFRTNDDGDSHAGGNGWRFGGEGRTDKQPARFSGSL